MIRRIAVSSKVGDARARHYLDTLKTKLASEQAMSPGASLASVSTAAIYTIDANVSPAELKKLAERLANPIIETQRIDEIPHPAKFSYAVEIGFLPGVTDNVGKTVREMIEDQTGRKLRMDEHVYSSIFLFLDGTLTIADVELLAKELYNPLIERASIYTAEEGKKNLPDGRQDFPVIVPKVHLLATSSRADKVNLDVSDTELAKIGKEGIENPDGTRRGPLALSLTAMKTIKAHFEKLGRNPTDVELEALAGTWSEHCKHTIFADPLDEVKEGIYKKYIKGATEKIRKQKGKKDFCVSVFKDNAGAIIFDNKYLITHKVETHNAPSALDPFGGSVTAIVGVNRDCLGFGLGAKPIANVYGFCVGDPTDTSVLYRDAEKKQPLLPSKRILEGVVKGVNAGGNQSGIPTPLGFVAVDPSFRGKPLVFGGTVGLIPKKVGARKMYEKKARPGDYIVMLGGRVGLDGIHGATFSSESLSKGSPATAVQIGDPITQKKLSDALIREARDAGLYTSITDNGAGGLSGSIGEMSREAGGCVVELEKVPLKYPGLSPWQIWLSESQERMTLAVPKSKWNAFKKIMDRYDVEATRIGTFVASGKCTVRFEGKTVMDLSLAFLHDGRPIHMQKSKEVALPSEKFVSPQGQDAGETLVELLSRPNIGSTAFISSQYDHEVQGASVTKPLQGRGLVNADAGILQPLPNSPRGVVLAHGYCPWYSEIDTKKMAAAAIDTAVRSAICGGASREHLAILDNFCWSTSEKPERLYELKRAAEACYETAVAYGTPFISGKDSMFNDFRGFTKEGKPIHIAALPTLLASAIGVIPDVERAMTLDFKKTGDSVYLLGETNNELGASEYAALVGARGGEVPEVDTKKNAKIYDTVSAAISKGIIASAIGVGRGGLAVALSKSAIGGQLGAKVALTKLPGNARSPENILFSESQGRILVSVSPNNEKKFISLMKNIPYVRLGEVGGNSLSIQVPGKNIEAKLADITTAYRSLFKHW